MPIYTNSLIVTGTNNTPIYTNTMSMNGYSNVTIESDLSIRGSVYATGRTDVGTVTHATFRLSSNVPFISDDSEVLATSNMLYIDLACTNMNSIASMPLAVSPMGIYNADSGEITIPTNGLYTLSIQGSFNSVSPASTLNGVYLRFIHGTHPSTRVAASVTTGSLVSTTHTAYLNGGEKFVHVFYSSSSNTILSASDKETYIAFALHGTFTES